MNQPNAFTELPSIEADVERAESRVARARERAAHTALSAAESLDRSAQCHDAVADIEESEGPQSCSLRRSASKHRAFAAEDRDMAQKKRQEADGYFNFRDDR